MAAMEFFIPLCNTISVECVEETTLAVAKDPMEQAAMIHAVFVEETILACANAWVMNCLAMT